MSRAAEKKITEEYVLSLLRKRYSGVKGNGEEYAFLTHVRDAASWDAQRTIDALSMSLWKSRGCELHGYEVKCQRRDWLNELRNPAKADAWCKLVDRFWLVAGSAEVVRAGELPPTWGLMIVKRGQIVVEVEAPRLRAASKKGIEATLPPGLNRSALAAMMRSACRVGGVTPEEVTAARQQAEAYAEEHWSHKVTTATQRHDRIQANVQAFEEAAGVSLEWLMNSGEAAAIGALVKRVRAGERVIEQTERGLERVVGSAQGIAESVAQALADLRADEEVDRVAG